MPRFNFTEGTGIKGKELLQNQRLLKQVWKLGEDRVVESHEACAGFNGIRLELAVILSRKSDNRNVSGVRIVFHVLNDLAHVYLLRDKINHDHQWTFFARGLNQQRRFGNGVHAIAEVLQPVYQLAAGQKSLIID